MNREAIYHCSSFSYAYPVEKDVLCVRLMAQQDDIKEVKVYFRNLYEHERPMETVPMERILNDGLHDIYEARIQVKEKRFKYMFEIHSDEHIFYTSDGFLQEWTENNCFFYPYINPDEILEMPDWAEGKLIYQILVDRFWNGDPGNNPKGCRAWEELPDGETYYGGDFEGVIQKLPYLEKLGVDILYINPVFSSPTYHKYDIRDYYRIEDIFGGKEVFKKLVDCVHARGMRLVLDGVFNHCSVHHPFFQDVLKNGPKSEYREWFCLYSYPVEEVKANYDSFGGLVPSMPRWNTANYQVIEYLTESAAYWTEYLNVDGWRLDVADEVAHIFWKEFRRRLKGIRPDILLLGEIWNHASQWMCGDEMHTVTNYKFRNAILEYAQGYLSEKKFWQKIDNVRMLYKTPMHTYLVNLAGSHDVARLGTVLKDSESVKLVLLTLLTFQGMPLLYYGDEIGMEGGEDPDNRRAMQWSHADECLLAAVAKTGRFRKEHEILQKGNLSPIETEEHLLAFSRSYKGEKLNVYLNFHEEQALLPKKKEAILFWEGEVDIEEDYLRIKKGGMIITSGE